MRRLPLFLLILALAIFFLGGPVWKNNLLALFNGLWRWDLFNAQKIQSLKIENEKLKAEIWQLVNKIEQPKSDYTVAQIHSSYPFNNKNILSINVGTEQGVGVGMPVTVSNDLLLGKVKEVFKNYSLVETIFSSDWELPVRIGHAKIPALLIGGPSPKVAMIVNDKPIADGQVIFSAHQDFPYGLKMGEIINVQSDSLTGLFKEAGIKLGYDFNELTELTVLLWSAD